MVERIDLEADVPDLPYPRDLFIEMAMEQWGLSRPSAERLVDETLGSLARVQ